MQHEPVTCEFCGVQYRPKQAKAKNRYCSKECGQAARNAELRGNRAAHLKKKYGLDEAAFNAMLAAQDDRCAICRLKLPGGKGAFHVDHCHVTGRVRGLLCMLCNHGLGNFRDDPLKLRAAAAYLEARHAT